MDLAQPTNKKDIALVLIHGIGDIEPGNVLQSAMNAISGRPDATLSSLPTPMALTPNSQGNGEVSVKKAELTWQNRVIEIIEFNWTGVTGKIRFRRALDALVKWLQVMREFPLIGTRGTTPWIQKFARGAGAFQYWIIIALMLAITGSIFENVRNPTHLLGIWTQAQESVDDKVQNTDSSFDKKMVVVSNLTIMALPEFWNEGFIFTILTGVLLGIGGTYYVLTVYFYLIFLIVRWFFSDKLRLAHFFWRTLFVSGILTFYVGLIFYIIWLGVLLINTGLYSGDIRLQYLLNFKEFPTLQQVLVVMYGLMIWYGVKYGLIIGNLLRDVIHYLAPDPMGKPMLHQQKIRTELARLLSEFEREKYNRVVLVAHSLGTVIVTDLLTDCSDTKPKPWSFTLDLVTIGSPLRRLIFRLLPNRDTPQELRKKLNQSTGLKVERWFNAYRLFDYVGQALTYSALPKDLVMGKRNRTDTDQGIHEVLLEPRYKIPFSHSNYWGDPRFLKFLATKVVQPIIEK
ncbi:MAG: hypothetical protein NPIRA04_08010 [Nitrospirales bacterium]|nr:MAG: hypothetical protein NPIRA04_08010 [Nitrospirales bacterium]